MVFSGNAPLAEKDKCFSIFCKMYENEDRWSGLSQNPYHLMEIPSKHNFKHFDPKKALKIKKADQKLLNFGREGYFWLLFRFKSV